MVNKKLLHEVVMNFIPTKKGISATQMEVKFKGPKPELGKSINGGSKIKENNTEIEKSQSLKKNNTETISTASGGNTTSSKQTESLKKHNTESTTSGGNTTSNKHNNTKPTESTTSGGNTTSSKQT